MLRTHDDNNGEDDVQIVFVNTMYRHQSKNERMITFVLWAVLM